MNVFTFTRPRAITYTSALHLSCSQRLRCPMALQLNAVTPVPHMSLLLSYLFLFESLFFRRINGWSSTEFTLE